MLGAQIVGYQEWTKKISEKYAWCNISSMRSKYVVINEASMMIDNGIFVKAILWNHTKAFFYIWNGWCEWHSH